MRGRGAFTILEVLIVINVIALVLVRAVPAIFAALEAARSLQCRSNLRQIGAAVHNYVAMHEVMPAAAIWSTPGLVLTPDGFRLPGTVALGEGDPNGWQHDRFRSSFFVSLLSHLDARGEYDLWNFSSALSSPQNETAREISLAVFLCPSDFRQAPCKLSGGGWARGNYAVNAGTGPLCLASAPQLGQLQLPDVTCRKLYPLIEKARGVEIAPLQINKINEVFGSGVAGINRCFRPGDLTDGQSKTIIVEEIISGIDPMDRRGCWGMPGIGSSVTFGHGHWSAGGLPNSRRAIDIVQDGSDKFFPPSDGSRRSSMKASPRSRHPGRIHVVLADGSVMTIVNEIDAKLWTSLHTRDDGDNVAIQE